MKRMVKIIRKADLVKQQEQMLLSEQDYWLGSLWVAMQDCVDAGKCEALYQLRVVHDELEYLKEYA